MKLLVVATPPSIYQDCYIQRMVNIEDSDSSNDGSEVDPDENQDEELVQEVNEGEEEKYPLLGRGHMLRNQTTTNYVPSLSNNSLPKGDPKGVNLAQV